MKISIRAYTVVGLDFEGKSRRENPMNLLKDRPRSIMGPSTPTLARMRDEMERAFNRFVRDPFDLVVPPEQRSWMPALDVTDTDAEIIVKAEIPGMTAKEINVSLTGNRLTLSGEKEERKENKDECCYISERRFGSFFRVIELPEGIDPEKITADQADGVLTVKIAKSKAAKPKHIPVKGHSQ
jgi:HSP20 family protein